MLENNTRTTVSEPKIDKLSDTELWGFITEKYGYSDVLKARDNGLRTLVLEAEKHPDSDDPLIEVRRRAHIGDFKPALGIFLKPSKRNGEVYRFMSGWYMLPSGFQYAGREWRSLEHAYQASKFAKSEQNIASQIHRAAIPLRAKLIGNKHIDVQRYDWKGVRDLAMLGPVLSIAETDENVSSFLRGEGKEAVLVEDSIRDQYWGRGPIMNGSCLGQSKLGCTWMLARNIIEKGDSKRLEDEIGRRFVF